MSQEEPPPPRRLTRERWLKKFTSHEGELRILPPGSPKSPQKPLKGKAVPGPK
jgi:hypothetical protein